MLSLKRLPSTVCLQNKRTVFENSLHMSGDVWGQGLFYNDLFDTTET